MYIYNLNIHLNILLFKFYYIHPSTQLYTKLLKCTMPNSNYKLSLKVAQLTKEKCLIYVGIKCIIHHKYILPKIKERNV